MQEQQRMPSTPMILTMTTITTMNSLTKNSVATRQTHQFPAPKLPISARRRAVCMIWPASDLRHNGHSFLRVRRPLYPPMPPQPPKHNMRVSLLGPASSHSSRRLLGSELLRLCPATVLGSADTPGGTMALCHRGNAYYLYASGSRARRIPLRGARNDRNFRPLKAVTPTNVAADSSASTRKHSCSSDLY